MNILIADRFPEEARRRLQEAGHTCDYRPDLGAADLPAALGGVDVLVVRSTRVEEPALAAADRLGLVVRAGAGTNTIAVSAAADRGIFVCNVPGENAVAVAELAFGLLAAIDRNIPDNVSDLRRGVWDKTRYQQARGLLGRDVGVVGVGAIGLAFARRARAFGMTVHVVTSPRRSPDTAADLELLRVVEHPSLADLAGACDVLTFHVPLTPDTEGLVGRELLARVRPGTIILNTSRGEIVDEEALLAAIEEKGLRAGLDVWQGEPAAGQGEFASPLASHPAVYGTHHIGASTEQAQLAIADGVVRIIAEYDRGDVTGAVNEETHARGTSTLVVRHRNEVGVLASVLGALSGAGINVEHMENRIFAGGTAASAVIRVTGDVSARVRDQIAAAPAVLAVILTEDREQEEG